MIYSPIFLEHLFSQTNRSVYVKVTSLTIDEYPQETIEGRATSGSINVDGKSAVRRTCQLTLVSDTNNLNEYCWGLHTKFFLEVGISNDVDKNYPEIIWFPQGVFVITAFSLARTANNFTMNISGKDKMCLLNGEVGGNLPYEVDFGQWEEVDENNNITLHKYPLKDIIREAVHYYGGEPFHNIVINDLEDRGLELQEYRLDSPMYLIRPARESGNYIQGTLNGGQRIYIQGVPSTIGSLEDYEYDMLISGLEVETAKPTTFTFGSYTISEKKEAAEKKELFEPEESSGTFGQSSYCAAKIVYGQTVGYTPTEMTYTGSLVAKAGEAITATLDKIKNMLGNFEYFYDVDGRFIFREQQNYINTSWSPVTTTSDSIMYVNPSSSKIQFTFKDSTQITAMNKNLGLNNLKNDYSVWGNRISTGGQKIPIHMRYAIDSKPIIYRTIEVSDEEAQVLDPNLSGQKSVIYISEIAKDYVYTEVEKTGLLSMRFNMSEDFVDNQTFGDLKLSLSRTDMWHEGMERYEGQEENEGIPDPVNCIKDIDLPLLEEVPQDIIQLHCDWRELIYQMALDYRKYNHLDDFELKVAAANPQMCPSGRTGYEQYYVDLEGFWRQLYDYSETSDQFYPATNQERKYWNKNVYEAPEQLNFWFDFLESDGELFDYSVQKIGSRTKVVNDKDVQTIYYKDTPQVLFTNENNEKSNYVFNGYNYINIPKFYGNMFKQSAQGKSAKRAIDDLMYTHSYCSETVSLTAIPVYSLQPNQRIQVWDDELGVNEEYLVSSFNIPFAYNGTMNIQANRTIDRII